jgi:uncharacterized protein YodC (DUF2158 family)
MSNKPLKVGDTVYLKHEKTHKHFMTVAGFSTKFKDGQYSETPTSFIICRWWNGDGNYSFSTDIFHTDELNLSKDTE